MKARSILFVFIFSQSFNVFPQVLSIKRDSIPWNTNYSLKWTDFMGKPDTSIWIAVCAASIYVKGFWEDDLPNFLVSNAFIKNNAWTRDTTSTGVLRHEQLHFDIAEVYARKIRKSVDSLRRKKIKTIEAYSTEIQKLLKIRRETDGLYDEETIHGVNGKEQADWNKKILKELNDLSAYHIR